ncbi:hypothetical protein QFC22_005062 [Naganishia vaughanmartiniae]|uniref:Uncharacterized protein n=1 Tax=Naganishia vaughanmartiniae TaxID=1424756 RepID=A0ACC2WXS0_9TREE|nr:hypothetical protein QFC22_005062 [Naganishia vaughanmartiniae]
MPDSSPSFLVPVTRAADLAKSGAGVVYLDPSDHLKVIGVKSSFKKQCMVRGQIVLPKEVGYATGEIAEVVSDTEIRLSREFITTAKGGASDVKATTRVLAACAEANDSEKKGLVYKILPHVDQHEVYSAVFNRLNGNGAIGIFPEGGSHDRPDLLPLKAGVSVMALGAMSANPNLNIKLVPVGLSYFHPHKFRSRAVVEFGAPVEVPRELVDGYEKGGLQKREACGKLLEMVHDGLKAVTIRTPDFDTLMVIQAGRRLYKTPGQHWTLGQVVALNKRFIEAYLHYQNEPRIIALRRKITAYNRRLRDLGLRDHQVERATNPRRLRNAALLLYRSGLLLAWSILALPGVVTHAPIFIPAKIVSQIKAKEALAASTVKLEGRDILATWKVLFSIVATPLLYTIYSIIAAVIAYKKNAPPVVLHWMPVWIFVGMPFLAMSSLKFGEAGMDVFKSLRPLFLSLLPGAQKELEGIKQTRENLANELSELINEFGPQLWVNFHQSSLRPNATVPQTGEQPGLIYRKGQAADSSVLSHPMMWLDERIFGWSRSAIKGPGAWNAKYARSDGETEPGSPTMSDGEELGDDDDVDYDDVLAIIDRRKLRNGGRDRSRSNAKRNRNNETGTLLSADGSHSSLDKLADSILQGPSSAAETHESLHQRSEHTRRHSRGESLGDGISLEHLREATRKGSGSFDEITADLNKEVEDKRRKEGKHE